MSASDRYFSALNELDREAYLRCFADDADLLDPYGGRPFQGHEGLSKWFSGMERTWAEFQMVPQASYASGDRVAVHWKATASSKSGKRASFSGINVFTMDESGLILRLEGYWDAASMMEQIT